MYVIRGIQIKKRDTITLLIQRLQSRILRTTNVGQMWSIWKCYTTIIVVSTTITTTTVTTTVVTTTIIVVSYKTQFRGSGAQVRCLWHTSSTASWHVASSQSSAQTHVPCIGRWTQPLDHQGNPRIF